MEKKNPGEQKAAYLNRVLDAVHMLASTIHSLATGDGHSMSLRIDI